MQNASKLSKKVKMKIKRIVKRRRMKNRENRKHKVIFEKWFHNDERVISFIYYPSWEKWNFHCGTNKHTLEPWDKIWKCFDFNLNFFRFHFSYTNYNYNKKL